jgi:hypothetical protein
VENDVPHEWKGKAKAGFLVAFIDKTLPETSPETVVTVNQDAAFISIKTGNERIPSLGAADTRVSFALVSSAVT